LTKLILRLGYKAPGLSLNHDLSDAHWQDNWADIGVDSKYNSVPGLYVNGTSYVYMFYHSLSDSKIHRIRFNGTTWDNDTVMFEFPNYGNSWVVLMPISTTFFYMNIRPVNDTDAGLHYSQIYKVDTGVYTSYTNLSADASCVLLYLFQDPVDQTATHRLCQCSTTLIWLHLIVWTICFIQTLNQSAHTTSRSMQTLIVAILSHGCHLI